MLALADHLFNLLCNLACKHWRRIDVGGLLDAQEIPTTLLVDGDQAIPGATFGHFSSTQGVSLARELRKRVRNLDVLVLKGPAKPPHIRFDLLALALYGKAC